MVEIPFELRYKQVNGTSYHVDTPVKVIEILERARKNGRPIRIYLGDKDTGRDFNEENDLVGTVGRSTGSLKVPLLIKKNASGGGQIDSDSIVKIRYLKSEKVLWQHPTYKCGVIEVVRSVEPGYTHSVTIDYDMYSNHKTQKDAFRLAVKLL